MDVTRGVTPERHPRAYLEGWIIFVDVTRGKGRGDTRKASKGIPKIAPLIRIAEPKRHKPVEEQKTSVLQEKQT